MSSIGSPPSRSSPLSRLSSAQSFGGGTSSAERANSEEDDGDDEDDDDEEEEEMKMKMTRSASVKSG